MQWDPVYCDANPLWQKPNLDLGIRFTCIADGAVQKMHSWYNLRAYLAEVKPSRYPTFQDCCCSQVHVQREHSGKISSYQPYMLQVKSQFTFRWPSNNRGARKLYQLCLFIKLFLQNIWSCIPITRSQAGSRTKTTSLAARMSRKAS